MVAFDAILNQHLTVKYQGLIRRSLCPICWYPLEDIDGKGLHCKFCGWKENETIRFIPRSSDQPIV